ncbi:cohesin domain-containing protein [Natronobacterium gregoryi]|uniref:Cohesin domain protein n=2 Tax=Natronobacterium gregoryi TaxID=44930 RepID=L0ADG1_NATGS|nr:cohesin domain-containing protein [Natronobacterium gregoryi]AFZ71469.1 Cohesin domain protein [Natronobacterium gregoryi SP2]ELY66771.1 hypothetical protein C490_12180 [Natronobacterium gregoryi SP2]PLK19937.1 hypothetical protein CYV19_12060 [Natronobacterium gregoryi SP2]SFJ36454.1 Cohesin domain-containing protein [Natronobacterium gregoryi]
MFERSRLPTTALALALVCAVAGTVVVGTFAAPAAAGDNIAIFALDPAETDAEVGETIEIDLVVSTHGDYVGDGIDELSATVVYDADVFSVAEVTHGEMLAHGDPDAEVTGSSEVADGEVTISQEREPSGDGAATTEPAATIAFDIAPDAPTANETLEITDASAILVSDYPQGTIERESTVSIDAVETSSGSSASTDAVPGVGAIPVLALGGAGLILYLVRQGRS